VVCGNAQRLFDHYRVGRGTVNLPPESFGELVHLDLRPLNQAYKHIDESAQIHKPRRSVANEATDLKSSGSPGTPSSTNPPCALVL
jgi:hypothetical protein